MQIKISQKKEEERKPNLKMRYQKKTTCYAAWMDELQIWKPI